MVDVERRAVALGAELCRLRHEDFTEAQASQIRSDVKEIRVKWLEKIASKSCPEHYWKGYELVKEIARKFGKANLAPVSLAVCSISFPKSMVAQEVDAFQEMVSQEKYNVDKRLELISKIPEGIVQSFPLNNEWVGLTNRLLLYLGEKELTKEFDFEQMVRENYTNPAFPKEFLEIAEIELPGQFERARDMWKNLENKGIDSSQMVALFNVVGEAVMMSNFETVDNPETDKILSVTYRIVLNGLDKVRFINDLLERLNGKNKLERWMETLWGFGDLERFRDMFPFQKLVSLDELCLICHKPYKYANPTFCCPHSGLHVCFSCCTEMDCSNCEKFQTKQRTLSEIAHMLDTFTYNL